MRLLSVIERGAARILEPHYRLKEFGKLAWQSFWSLLPSSHSPSLTPTAVYANCFFGFHAISPWSDDGVHLAVHFATPFRDDCKRRLWIGIISPIDSDEFQRVATTSAWNWQQGAQLRWHPTRCQILFNDFSRLGQPVIRQAFIRDTGCEVGFGHLADVHPRLSEALTIDYQRIGLLMPGYGYPQSPKSRMTIAKSRRSMVAIDQINLCTGQSTPIVFRHQLDTGTVADSRYEAAWAVSHCSYSPDGRRIAFFLLQRGTSSRARLRMTLFVLNMASGKVEPVPVSKPSHFCWTSGSELVVTCANNPRLWTCEFLQVDEGYRKSCVLDLPFGDAHPATLRNSPSILLDSYPDRARIQRLFIFQPPFQRLQPIYQLRSPLRFSGPRRCDFHPRWKQDGSEFCIDAVLNRQRCLMVFSSDNLA